MKRKPHFKYYLDAFEDEKPEPMFGLWVENAKGFSDVCGETILAAGLPLPTFPDYKTWKRLVLLKLRCGRCWAATRGQTDLNHHNQQNHPGAHAHYPRHNAQDIADALKSEIGNVKQRRNGAALIAFILLASMFLGGCKTIKKSLGIYHPDTDIYGPPTVEGIIRDVPDSNVVDFYFMRVKPEATIVGYLKDSTMFVRGDQWYDVRVTTSGVEPAALDEYIYVDRTTDIAYIYNSPHQRRAMTLYQVPPGYSHPGRPSAGSVSSTQNFEVAIEEQNSHELY